MKSPALILILIVLFLTPAWAQAPNLTLTSPAFKDNQEIPSKYTCKGDDVNPPLIIRNIPVHAKSLVLWVHDSVSSKEDWTHWLVYNIKPTTRIITENFIPGDELINDFNKFHYGGPCPSDTNLHHYIFELFALSTTYTLNENGSPQGLLQKIQGSILERTRLVATYRNPA